MVMLMLRATMYIHALGEQRIKRYAKWPKTWWDAFKDRWFPVWAKKRWPVEWSELRVDEPVYQAVCPHFDSDPRDVHIQWLVRANCKSAEWSGPDGSSASRASATAGSNSNRSAAD